MVLSVIIPVYKVENTLDRCVESVLQQTIAEMEVILVDDGSPDGCGKMCDSWALKDERIKVIHQNNGGLSKARNAGIDIARGRYITFVDSDDRILPDTYCRLLEKLVDSDIDILEYNVIHEKVECVRQGFDDIVYDSSRQYWLKTKGWNHAYSWNKIYKRQLFESVRFEEGKIFEDILLMPVLLAKNPKVATTSIKGYVYTANETGISCKVSVGNCRKLLVAEIKATLRMRTMPWGNGRNLYYQMLCRIYDIIRLSL